MVTRREMNGLLAAATLVPMPLVQALSAVNHQSTLDKKPLHFIYEARASAYGYRGKLAKDSFDKLHVINGDVTSTWYHELHPLWRESKVFTAGLTRESEFFVLKTLARDYGYRVEFESEPGNSHLVSWLLIPA